MEFALLALGLVLIAEGLLYALAPNLVEELLAMLRALSHEQRRTVGLVAFAIGVALVWMARALGA